MSHPASVSLVLLVFLHKQFKVCRFAFFCLCIGLVRIAEESLAAIESAKDGIDVFGFLGNVYSTVQFAVCFLGLVEFAEVSAGIMFRPVFTVYQDLAVACIILLYQYVDILHQQAVVVESGIRDAAKRKHGVGETGCTVEGSHIEVAVLNMDISH